METHRWQEQALFFFDSPGSKPKADNLKSKKLHSLKICIVGVWPNN